MVLSWRRAFCTSIPKDEDRAASPIITDKPSPRLRSRFTGFFSEPSTPRLPVSSPSLRCTTPAVPSSDSPRLQCRTRKSPRFFHSSAPCSPRSPSTFSLLKSGLRITKEQSRCGICLQSVKTGQGTAIFTAECGDAFHFPCIAAHMKKQGTGSALACPICSATWKEMHLVETDQQQINPSPEQNKSSVFKVYNDDEPLSSPTSGARFIPIPESDETEEENDDFPGFYVVPDKIKSRNVEVGLLSEAAVVSVGKTSETYAVVLKVRAPMPPPRRAPIDLVTVLNVSRSVTADKLHLMRRVLRMVVSSLSAADRLSIVAFSTTSKRLLPLRRMTTSGRRSARRIIDAVVALDGGATSATDSLKKAAKVIEDRREKNPAASILLLSDGHRGSPLVSSTRFSHMEIPVHTVNLSACVNAPPGDQLPKSITGLLSQVMQELRVQVSFAAGSAPGEISAVYSYAGKPALVGSGSSWCRVGELHAEEERELLVEMRVPPTTGGARRLMSVRCCYRELSTQQTIYDKERCLVVPRPRAVGSSTRDIQRLRCLFVTTRAVAESRRLAERNDVAGALNMLASARALVLQSGSGSGEEFVRGLEAELAVLNWKRQDQVLPRARPDDKAEPLTPTSAWRAAERLAKVAIMRKSLNRVSDLHGFENARF
ncbi:probable E3 ubiquitin-protein ligase EDA40 [Salvia miltiorrhiza]|uniref:probable E3 ubiquitin-protein ligase EDA40 n=1 Tax=Salvia miltiorrhiza TaxID=226208 RepID=UPI0025AC46BA|nr:probable E3 ubiquitin-protein ligase EDA40 [Salvia miltiorrhiza]XP_057784341.1 probable E3 ubiquitin-protein ligase EDA40 [Salvia miltiorrhiza]